MFDFIRDIGKPQAEKDREMLGAYVDGQLSAADARRMEQKLQADPALQAEADRLLLIKQQLRGMPHRRVPRSFVLDPTVYGAPDSRPLSGAYPLLRTATALTALLFVFLLGFSLFQGSLGPDVAPAAQVALFEAVEESAADMAEAPAAEEARLAEEAGAETAAGAAPEALVEEEALESAEAETMLVEPEAQAELALPADALDLGSTAATADDAAANGVAESLATAEEATREPPPPEALAAEGEAAAEPRAETEVAVAEEAAPEAAGLAVWLPWILLALGVAFVALLLLTAIAGSQRHV